jgi:hypothetical protein
MSQGELPQRIKQTIDMEKCLTSVLWFLSKVHSLTAIAKEMTHNPVLLCNHIMLCSIIDINLPNGQKMLKRFVTSMNKAPPHNSRLTQECILASMSEHLQHWASSSDPTPGNFFLFGHMKGKLISFNCTAQEELRIAIIGVSHGLRKRLSHRASLHG